MRAVKFMILCFALLSVSAESRAFELTGELRKSKTNGNVVIDLRAGSAAADAPKFRMLGTLAPSAGSLLPYPDVDFKEIRVTKEGVQASDGETNESLENKGLLTVYPRERMIRGGVLAGVPVEGRYLITLREEGMDLEGLRFNGAASVGRIVYERSTGRFQVRNECRIGENTIQGSAKASPDVVFTFDTCRNLMALSMRVGTLSLDGSVQFSERSVEGSTEVVARFNCRLTRQDGTPMRLPRDERDLLSLLAFLELIAFDFFGS